MVSCLLYGTGSENSSRKTRGEAIQSSRLEGVGGHGWAWVEQARRRVGRTERHFGGASTGHILDIKGDIDWLSR